MPTHTVSARDPKRIASAVIRYQVVQPRFAVSVFVVFALVALLGSSRGAAGGVGAAAVFAALVGTVVAFKRAQLTKTLRRSAYRPGATVWTDFGPDGVTVATAAGSARYPYDAVSSVRRVGGVVILRFVSSRSVVALPAEVVPVGAFA